MIPSLPSLLENCVHPATLQPMGCAPDSSDLSAITLRLASQSHVLAIHGVSALPGSRSPSPSAIELSGYTATAISSWPLYQDCLSTLSRL